MAKKGVGWHDEEILACHKRIYGLHESNNHLMSKLKREEEDHKEDVKKLKNKIRYVLFKSIRNITKLKGGKLACPQQVDDKHGWEACLKCKKSVGMAKIKHCWSLYLLGRKQVKHVWKNKINDEIDEIDYWAIKMFGARIGKRMKGKSNG